MKLSIVSTLYKSAPYVLEFHKRATSAARQVVGEDYEIILVDDGSPDNSLSIATTIAIQDPRLTVIELSRNFGHHKAMMTGLQHVKGELIFLIDSDLEEEPEWLVEFNKQMQEKSCDVVFGVQERRRGAALDRIFGSLFYKIFRFLTGVAQPDNIVTARLMTKKYVQSLIAHQEKEINIGGLWIITGFLQTEQRVKKHSSSETTYDFRAKLGHLINAITSFSSKPLTFTFFSGALISVTAILFVIFLIIRTIIFANPPEGYTSLIASVWLFSGIIIFFLGLQGIYLGKIFSEVKQRPLTIVKKIHGAKAAAN